MAYGENTQIEHFKGAQSYYSKLRFHLYVGNLYSTGLNLKFQSVKPFGCTKQFCKLQPPILYYVSLIRVTITSHIFTAIFSREYVLAIKFLVGNDKNMGHLLIQKSHKKKKKKKKRERKKIGLGSCK